MHCLYERSVFHKNTKMIELTTSMLLTSNLKDWQIGYNMKPNPFQMLAKPWSRTPYTPLASSTSRLHLFSHKDRFSQRLATFRLPVHAILLRLGLLFPLFRDTIQTEGRNSPDIWLW